MLEADKKIRASVRRLKSLLFYLLDDLFADSYREGITPEEFSIIRATIQMHTNKCIANFEQRVRKGSNYDEALYLLKTEVLDLLGSVSCDLIEKDRQISVFSTSK